MDNRAGWYGVFPGHAGAESRCGRPMPDAGSSNNRSHGEANGSDQVVSHESPQVIVDL